MTKQYLTLSINMELKNIQIASNRTRNKRLITLLVILITGCTALIAVSNAQTCTITNIEFGEDISGGISGFKVAKVVQPRGGVQETGAVRLKVCVDKLGNVILSSIKYAPDRDPLTTSNIELRNRAIAALKQFKFTNTSGSNGGCGYIKFNFKLRTNASIIDTIMMKIDFGENIYLINSKGKIVFIAEKIDTDSYIITNVETDKRICRTSDANEMKQKLRLCIKHYKLHVN